LLIGLYGNWVQLAAAIMVYFIHRLSFGSSAKKALSYASTLFAGLAVAHFLWEAQKPDYPVGIALVPILVTTTAALLLAGATSIKFLSVNRSLLITLISGVCFLIIAVISDAEPRVWPILVVLFGWLFVALSFALNLISVFREIQERIRR
jgi:hypothetical protein